LAGRLSDGYQIKVCSGRASSIAEDRDESVAR
jgi:hypothetical protein